MRQLIFILFVIGIAIFLFKGILPALKIKQSKGQINGAEAERSREKSTREKDFTESTKKTIENVLGQTVSLISEAASRSAETASGIIVQSTASGLAHQIEKLPEKQREEIKQQLCK